MKRLLIALAVLGLLVAVAPPVQAASFDATVTWGDNSSNESGFNVYRKTTTSGTYAKVGTVGAGITTFADTGLAVNTQYCYQVGAFNAVNEVLGPEACATTGAPVSGAPGAPVIQYQYKP